MENFLFCQSHSKETCHHLNFAYTLNLHEFDNECKEKTVIDSWSKSKLVSLVIWFFRCGGFHDKTDTCKAMEVVCKFIYFEVIISTCISTLKVFSAPLSSAECVAGRSSNKITHWFNSDAKIAVFVFHGVSHD